MTADLFGLPEPQPATPLRGAHTTDQASLVQVALLAGAGSRPRTWVLDLLTALGERNAAGKRWTGLDVTQAMKALATAGRIVEERSGSGYWRVADDQAIPTFHQLLQRWPAARLVAALAEVNGHPLREGQPQGFWHFRSGADAVAILRPLLFHGAPPQDMAVWGARCDWGVDWAEVLEEALEGLCDEALWQRLHPAWQVNLVDAALQRQMGTWRRHPTLPLASMAADCIDRAERDSALAEALETSDLRWTWAAALLLAGRGDEVEPIIAPLTVENARRSAGEAAHWDRLAEALEAHRLYQLGDWDGAIERYDVCWSHPAAPVKGKGSGKTSGRSTSSREPRGGPGRSGVPLPLATPYVLALMARGSAEDLRRALKFCLAEDGRRQPDLESPWGMMALALQIRLGEATRDLASFQPASRDPALDPRDWWRWMMRAWLADDGQAPLAAAAGRSEQVPVSWALLHARLVEAGLQHLAGQLDGALAVLQGRAAPQPFFVLHRDDGWRQTLAALADAAAPAGERGGSAVTVKTDATRLLWAIELDDGGALRGIAPFEQKQGLRGWGKPKPVPLSRLSKAEDLPAEDMPPARCLRQNPLDRTWHVDLAACAVALVGHPRLELAEQPGVPVTLQEAPPNLELLDEGDQLLLRLDPPPRPAEAPTAPLVWSRSPRSAAEEREQDALAALTLLRDSPQRLRLVRLNPAQRRVARLLGSQGLRFPREAVGQLEALLQQLGSHFQVHSDALPGAQTLREQPADSRLRAELTPLGDGMHLRLVAAPLGPMGPRLSPAQGRSRLIAQVEGETLGTERDLAAERSQLDSVLETCPMLAALPEGAPTAWDIEQPEAVLALVERLQALHAVAGLDWPQGRPIQVERADVGQLSVQVASRPQWLALEGGVNVNEQMVASLTRLLDWAATQKSRFVPLGEGRYLALTEALQARIEALARVAEPSRKADGPLQMPLLAAGWLEGQLAGADLRADRGFQDRIERLAAAQADGYHLPGTLQAELRPYQVEGYEWAMRLADSGFGACLADDMGLGKTLQALALLLARAAGGPALVVAPTSLMGNWAAEARRFAPALRVHTYAEGDAQGDREALLRSLGPQDLLLVSYGLLQLNAEAFAGRRWHTLVADEAQAIKNAAAKRSQAVMALEADFRLALSGTPIENRLAELWSIMQLCNPGLLGTLPRFNLRFAVPIERDRHRGAQKTLRALIGPFVLRRRKAEVLDELPPRTELTLLVEGDATEQAHYEALRRQALRDAERALNNASPGQAQLNILAQLTRLRRAACDPRLVTPDLALGAAGGAKVQAFARLATELVANGHKALVFSQFVDFLALLKAPLEAAGIRFQYLDGSTPAAERSARVAAFQAGVGELFLISLKAGGFGLNLTVADYVVITDPWWNPAAEDQASGRAHRIGQQRPVTVYRLVHRGTLEEKIVGLHADKRELAEGVLEGDGSGRALPVDSLLSLLQEGPDSRDLMTSHS